MKKLDILEGLLYIAGDIGLEERWLMEVLSLSKKELKSLIDTYDKPHLVIKVYGDKYFLQANEVMEAYYKDMIKVTGKSKLSQASLEVLSIIAYNQPVSRREIEHLRGVNSDGPLNTLLERRLIERKEVKDERYFHFRTTQTFLEIFGLSSIDDLPKDTLEEEEAALFFDQLEGDNND